ncbi:MAG: PleD family two-component system response regulator [bacterium]
MKILTVDDAKTVRTLIKNILVADGHEVSEAENGVQALNIIHSRDDIDIILLDWEMPEMDGLTFLTKIRTENLAPNTKIIMLTCLNKITNILKAMDAGADEYLMKPFTPEIILDKIHMSLNS